MKITNNKNLPLPYFLAVQAHDKKYSKGDAKYSCTGIIKPPLMAWLEKKHWDDIEVDCSDRLWAMIGTSVHKILEDSMGEDNNIVTERRLFGDIAGVRVSGQADLYFNDSMSVLDYKLTTAWSYVFGPKPEWIAQLNILAHLFRLNGLEPKMLHNMLFIRDFERRRIGESGYPTSDVCLVTIPLWPAEQARSFAEMRVRMHEDSEKCVDPSAVIPCTDEERWTRGEKWAVVPKGKKRAISGGLCDTEEEAKKVAESKSGLHVIEHRQGKRTRCEGYCQVAKWCPLAQAAGGDAANQ